MKIFLIAVGIPAAIVTLLALLVTAMNMPLFTILWIPLAMILFLAAFPYLAITKASSMLEGLFDLEFGPYDFPFRLMVVTVGAFSIAGTALRIGRLALLYGPTRYHAGNPHLMPWARAWIDLSARSSILCIVLVIAALCALVLPIAGTGIYVSRVQSSKRVFWKMAVAVVLTLAVCSGFAWVVIHLSTGWLDGKLLPFLLSFIFYVILGVYGWTALGKTRTVPALVSLLMVVLMLGWVNAEAESILGRWHIPLFLAVVAWAAINAWIPLADHTYAMVERSTVKAAEPDKILMAKGRKRAIVVAAAGGGIQSAAWTAQVLEGLRQLHGQAFDDALCLISSISGGSTGSACYINALANPQAAVQPFLAASASSLDEVAWGLAWPDLWRILFPWPFGKFIDRAGAMEIAWSANATNPGFEPQLKTRLSDWNEPAANGDLPAVIMNSTMVEVGSPLLLGTSDVNRYHRAITGRWMDGDQLHREGEREMDIPVVRAARLSATFPYVTPVARPAKANLQPHMIDGGLYDNYGVATLTEWLDQALENAEGITHVLVIQISGFPPSQFCIPKPPATQQGWFLQLVAPLTTLANVRVAGQVSHRDIELQMLMDKWCCRGVKIEDVDFNFGERQKDARLHELHECDQPVTLVEDQTDFACPDAKTEQIIPDPPLSWHLMPRQIEAIRKEWASGEFEDSKAQVARFLAGA